MKTLTYETHIARVIKTRTVLDEVKQRYKNNLKMRETYIIPNLYECEKDRLRFYKTLIMRERPWAKVLSKGTYFWRYYTETTKGTVFFEISTKSMGPILYSDTEQAYSLINFILL